MSIDLSYSNKEGITLQNIIDVLVNEKSKKDILSALNTSKSIDTLLKKLEDALLIKKTKSGNKVLYSKVDKIKKATKKTEKQQLADDKQRMQEQLQENFTPEQLEKINILKKEVQDKLKKQVPGTVKTEKLWIIDDSEIADIQAIPQSTPYDIPKETLTVSTPINTAPKLHKAKPKMDRAPAEIEKINKQTSIISKDHQITTLVEMEDEKITKNTNERKTSEINEVALDLLKKEMESRTGKEVTAILHKRKDRALKERKETAQEIYAKQQEQIAKDSEVYDEENPFRFALNFFTSTLNGERATPYFRRRDDYVVKSIYNKFKTLCTIVDPYILEPQNLPFYRVITINEQDLTIKIYHIDMNRIIRGSHTIFQLTESDSKFLEFKK